MFEVKRLDRIFEYRGFTIRVWKVNNEFTAEASCEKSPFVYCAFGESVTEAVGRLKNRMDGWMDGQQDPDDE